ncbi:MAG: ParB/RepB/Spo0J family partition protein [bacterium]
MKKEQALGKGLEALIRSAREENRFLELDLERIKPNPYQPRQEFSEQELHELALSLKEHGVLQPILVIETEPGNYELVAGERRVRAAKLAGLKTIPAVVVSITKPEEVLALALIENIQRANLNPIELAESFKALMENFGLTQEEIGALVGKSRTAVANIIRILKLPDEVKELVRKGKLSEGHARAILMAPDHNLQVHLANLVVKRGLSVERTEILASGFVSERKKAARKRTKPPELIALEEELSLSLGTKVTINPRGKKGQIVISYYSNDELQRLAEILLNKEI